VLRAQNKILKKIFSVLRLYIVISFVLGVVILINSEKYKISNTIYGIGYQIYGNTTLFLKDLYENTLKVQSNDQNNLNDIKLIRENAYLEQKYQGLVYENKLLKKQLKLIENTNYKYISAWVTQTTHPKGENAIVISVGAKDSVKVGNVVINEHGILGRISRTTEKFSIVSLLGNSNVKIAGIILPSYQNCIVGINASQDTGNLSLSIGYLSDVNGVNEGDAVISSGKDGITPFGLKIGAIIKSESNFFVSTKKQIFDSLIVQVIID